MKKILLLALFAILAPAAFAQVPCLAVIPGGAGSANGSNWSNALNGMPATQTRGTRYYLADGTYTRTSYSQATSSTTIIELRKAQAYDYGRSADGCSNDISSGWNAATMGSAQAVFGSVVSFSTAYYVLNGNGTLTDPGCGAALKGSQTVTQSPPTPSDCGIKVINSTSGNPGGISPGGANLLVEYVEEIGSAVNQNNEVFAPGTSNLTIRYSYLHNSGCVFIQDVGSNSVMDHDFFWGTQTNGAPGGACHGQADYVIGGENNSVRSNNVYKDITGTAVWTFGTSGVVTGWQIYNNVVTFSTPNLSFGGLSDAALDCINGVQCTGFLYYHNVIVNCSKGSAGFGPQCGVGFGDSATGGSVTIKDNLYYSNPSGISLTTNSTTVTEDYNSFLNSGNFGSGAHDVHVASGSANPFNNWQGGDFSLASDNVNWNNFVSLGAPYDTDITGLTFTTDRGAYQFVTTPPPFTCSPTVIPANHSNNIAVTCTGIGTSWNGSTAFSISGVTGATLASKSNSSATVEILQITTGTGTGTLTITDTTDSISTTIAVSTATLSITPVSGNTTTTPTLTMTGVNTLWLSETAAGLFTVSTSGCSGDSIATPTVSSNIAATAVLTTGSANCTITVTDTSTTATATFTVATPTAPTATTGTAGSLTISTAIISGNSYTCTGACATITSVGVCYATTVNPTTPCTSDGTASPWNSTLTGMAANTTYHFRAFATNSVGTAYGSDNTFLTPVISHVASSCSTGGTTTESSGNSWTFSCTPNAINDAVVFFVQCHPTAGTISAITLAASGWTLTQVVPPATTGSNSWGAIFGAIAPNTSAATFTATFTGASNCTNFAVHLNEEFAGNSTVGGTTTFNATGSASGAGSNCNQSSASLTPPANNEAVWYACLLGSATAASSPWTFGSNNTTGDSAEYQVLTGGAGLSQTPGFTSGTGSYIIEGVAISPPGASPPPAPAAPFFAGNIRLSGGASR